MTKRVMIIAGEASGDMHAAALVKGMKAIDPEALLRQLDVPRWREIVSRMEKKSQMALQAKGGMSRGGAPAPMKRPPMANPIPKDMGDMLKKEGV